MTARFYIIPEESAVAPVTGKGPKYLKWRFDPDPPGLDVPYIYMNYGAIRAGLLVANVTTEQHAELVGHADVAAAQEDIDQFIGSGAVPQVQAVLEALRIPADWVDTSYTYRVILRRLAGLMQFAQRHRGLHNEELITNPSQLDLRWNQIPQDRRGRIQATADSVGYNYSAVAPNWLVRRILMHLSDQWGTQPFIFYIEGKLDVVL